jgi:hypothetical protein
MNCGPIFIRAQGRIRKVNQIFSKKGVQASLKEVRIKIMIRVRIRVTISMFLIKKDPK